jgi:hypothetical protein
MLGIYFLAMLALFIACIVGAAWAYEGGLQSRIETPLQSTLVKYKVNRFTYKVHCMVLLLPSKEQSENGPKQVQYTSVRRHKI